MVLAYGKNMGVMIHFQKRALPLFTQMHVWIRGCERPESEICPNR